MTALLERNDTIVPSDEDAQLATESSRILSRHGDRELQVQLDDGQALPLPRALRELITHLLVEMSQGNAVTVIPVHAEMTTQEAADFLNVSRPHLVKLLETGQLPHHKVGTHRRVRFADLKAYKQGRAEARSKALEELVAQAQELDMGY
ncbi:helix-turn-helix domain-containing protein [Nitrospirillum sp. BR 11164]|uniref:helix-turn-helix domain-containing protein n=1 Tax=Nitrospirillum sp. BR 11164 TaxID=3104324 RepID=UPI002AFEB1BB|nr:helix-turn-helix domain-containing protein [Nitrospirillum sp. BR 11164]MEA1653117.1 helix-turn-helix domain-containing protein [Nitrospirillum sp. BR 11164]